MRKSMQKNIHNINFRLTVQQTSKVSRTSEVLPTRNFYTLTKFANEHYCLNQFSLHRLLNDS